MDSMDMYILIIARYPRVLAVSGHVGFTGFYLFKSWFRAQGCVLTFIFTQETRRAPGETYLCSQRATTYYLVVTVGAILYFDGGEPLQDIQRHFAHRPFNK